MPLNRKIEGGHYSNLGAQLDAIGKTDHPELSLVVGKVRAAVQSTGKSAHSLRLVSDSDSSKVSGTVLGQFDRRNKTTSIASFEQLTQSAEQSGQDVRDLVVNILKHESRHEASDRASGTKEVEDILTRLFGAESVLHVEEAMASKGTTESFDAYDEHRSKTSTYASELGLSTSNLVEIKLSGDSESLKNAILKKAA